jgi:site-specific DNA-methyltransferase (adenine-specific)
MIITGDCIDAMADMEPETVDAVVTDPPYGLGFMGKAWDSPTDMSGRVTPDKMQRWHEAWAAAALRVAKPGAYLLAFGGTRTVHRMTCAIEDAGWIIRDMLVWAYAQGFPKGRANLKPAWEPIVMARKLGPLRPLNIDGCRLPIVGLIDPRRKSYNQPGSGLPDGDRNRSPIYKGGWSGDYNGASQPHADSPRHDARGRWPANVILTDPIFDGGWDGVVGGGETAVAPPGRWTSAHADAATFPIDRGGIVPSYGDSGTYSRFFLIPKASRSDREPVLRSDRELPFDDFNRNVGNTLARRRENSHPTVKPTELMRHLVRLVTPPGGTVLDPFLGSGTTGVACEMEGFRWVGIEKEPEYVAIAEARLLGTARGLGLVG